MALISVLVLPFIFLISVSFGFFLFFKPIIAIEIQRKFYEKINWKIEPISMAKEVRNTRFMGLFLLALIAGFLTMILMLMGIIG